MATKKELQEELDNLGVEYTTKDNKDDLERKLKGASNVSNTDGYEDRGTANDKEHDPEGVDVTGKSYGVTPDDFPRG